MKSRITFLLLVLGLAGCQGTRVAQKSGSDLSQNGDGKTSFVTYVTPEEYQRMTPAERERLHATVGVEASARVWGNGKPASEAVSTSDLDKAMGSGKSQPGH